MKYWEREMERDCRSVISRMISISCKLACLWGDPITLIINCSLLTSLSTHVLVRLLRGTWWYYRNYSGDKVFWIPQNMVIAAIDPASFNSYVYTFIWFQEDNCLASDLCLSMDHVHINFRYWSHVVAIIPRLLLMLLEFYSCDNNIKWTLIYLRLWANWPVLSLYWMAGDSI